MIYGTDLNKIQKRAENTKMKIKFDCRPNPIFYTLATPVSVAEFIIAASRVNIFLQCT